MTAPAPQVDPSPGVDAPFFARCRAALAELPPFVATGRARSLVGEVLEVEGLDARVGSVCRVEPREAEAFHAEVVGFRNDRFVLMPLGECGGFGPDTRVRLVRESASVGVGESWLGRIVDGLGRPLDGAPPPPPEAEAPLYRASEPPLSRLPIREPLDVGVRSINALLTVGRGSRMGIFSGSGVGKSTLLGQVARHTEADVNVVALVGERGREVREFVEHELGDALERSVVVVATSDEAPLLRVRAAYVATALAESFRERGRHVLLLMDSLTRFCTALREIGLAAGQPPATRGYPPSMWAQLPKLLERAGNSPHGGSITGIYTVLMEGDDPNDPVVDAARSLLDGHVFLSRALAEEGQFPPVDVLASVSRVMDRIVPAEHLAHARAARHALASHRRAHDLISIGAYVEGSDPDVDRARRMHGPLRAFLRQGRDEASDLATSEAALAHLLAAENGETR